MKLMFCRECRDVLKLQIEAIRACKCGRSSGRYLPDGAHANVYGSAEVIGIANDTMQRALQRGDDDPGYRTLSAWLMGRDAPRVRWHELP